jgi:endo-1,4-beta-xylanase
VANNHATYLEGTYAGKFLGKITSEHGNYSAYVVTSYRAVDSVSIPVKQIWSIPERKRTGGTIDMAVHLNAWASFGFTFGKLEWQIVSIWSHYGSGNVNLTVEGP